MHLNWLSAAITAATFTRLELCVENVVDGLLASERWGVLGIAERVATGERGGILGIATAERRGTLGAAEAVVIGSLMSRRFVL